MGAVKRTHPQVVADHKYCKWSIRGIRAWGTCPNTMVWRPKHRRGFRDPVKGGLRSIYCTDECLECWTYKKKLESDGEMLCYFSTLYGCKRNMIPNNTP